MCPKTCKGPSVIHAEPQYDQPKHSLYDPTAVPYRSLQPRSIDLPSLILSGPGLSVALTRSQNRSTGLD